MRAFFLVLFAFLYFSFPAHAQQTPAPADTTTTKVKAADRDGSSFDKAIIIQEKTEGVGTRAEYTWIRAKYPGAKVSSQELSYKNGKPFDILNIVTDDGTKLAVYFDISNFFGKM